MKFELEELWLQAEAVFRGTVPSLVTLLLVFLCVLPYGIPGLSKVMPLLPVISIYFWSIYRPELTCLTCHFFIGLLQDILVGSPVGLSAATFIGIYAAVHYQRQFFHNKTFVVLWASFALLLVVVLSINFAIIALYNLSFFPLFPVCLQFLLTIALYPVLTRLFQWILRVSLRPA